MSINELSKRHHLPLSALPEPIRSELPDAAEEHDPLHDLLSKIEAARERLEKGDFSVLEPKPLKGIRKNLNKALTSLESLSSKVRNPDVPLKVLQSYWFDLQAIEQTLLSFLETMQEVEEAYGLNRCSSIRQIFQSIEIEPAQNETSLWQKTSSSFTYLATRLVFPPLLVYDGVQTTKKALSNEGQKEALQRHFTNKYSHLLKELKSFNPISASNPAKQKAFEKKASQLEKEESSIDLSPTRKRLVHSFLTLMQLSSHYIDSFKRESLPSLIQKEAKKQPLALTKEQEAEVAFVGKFLFDKGKILPTMSDAAFNGLIKKYPNTRSFLSRLRDQQVAVLEERIPALQEEYRNSLPRLRPAWIDLASAFGSLKSKKQAPEESHVRTAPAPRRGKEMDHPVSALSAASETPLAKWLQTEDFDMDPRLFAHLLGESFSKNSPFIEGFNAEKMLRFMRQAHRQKLSLEPETPGQKELVDQYDKALEITLSLQTTPVDLQAKLQEEIQDLKKGDSFFFPCSMPGYHQFVISFQKQENGMLTARIYNIGEGVAYHQKELREDQVYRNRFFQITDIPSSNINLAFSHLLFSIRNGNHAAVASDHYHALFAILKHDPTTTEIARIDSASQPREDLVLSPHAEFCTYLSLAYWEQHQNLERFLRSQIEIATKAYVSFRKQNLDHSMDNPLLNKGGEQLALLAQSAYERGVITQEEWSLIQQQIHPLPLEGEVLTYHPTALPTPFTGKVSLPPTDSFGKAENPTGKALDLLLPVPLVREIDAFIDQTKQFREKIVSEIRKENAEIVPTAILEWVEKLPFPIQKEWVDAFSPTQALDFLHLIREIGEDYVYAALRLTLEDERKPAAPRAVLAMIKLLSLGRELSLRSVDVGGVALPHLYQKNMDLLLEGTSSAQHLFDPNLEDQLLSLRDYWREKEPPSLRDSVSFFGVEQAKTIRKNYDYMRRYFFENSEKQEKICNHALCKIKWPDIDWIQEYVKKAEINDQISQDPELKDLPPIKLALTLFTTNHPLLPSAFHDLYALSHLVDIVFHAPFVNFMAKERKKGIEMTFDETSAWKGEKQIVYYADKPEAFRYSLESSLPGCTYNIEAQPVPQIDTNYALTLAQDRLPLSLEGLYHMQHWMEPCYTRGWTKSNLRRHVPPAYRMLEFPNIPPQITENYSEKHIPPKEQPHQLLSGQFTDKEVQEIREKLALSAIPSLQIRETLAYYANHPHLLEKKEEQIFFKKLIFEPPLLIEFLQQNPQEVAQFVSRFDEWVQKGFRTYKDLGNPLVASFYLEVMEKWERTLFYLNEKQPDLIPVRAPLSLRPIHELKGLIKQNLHTPEEAHLLYLDLLLLFKPDDLNRETVVDFLEALFKLEMVVWPLKFSDSVPQAYGLDRTIGKPWGWTLLAQNPDYPHEKTFLLKEQLLRLRGPLESLLDSSSRDQILNSVMQQLVPSFVPTEWTLAPQFPYFQTVSQGFYLDIAEGRLYEAGKSTKPLPRDFLEHAELAPYFGPNEQYPAFEVKPGVYEFSSKDKEKLRVFFREKEKKKSLVIQKQIEGRWAEKIDPLPLLPTYLQFVNEDQPRNYWLSVEMVNGEQSVWIENRWKGKITNGQLSEVHDLQTGWELGQLDPDTSSFLNRVESKKFILPWLDPATKQLIQIDLPRFSIHFKAEENGVLSSKEFEGYHVSKAQTLPALGRLTNYVILEKGQQKLILMPQHFRTVLPKNDLKAVAATPFELQQDPLLTYSLGQDGLLVPQSSAARLYLSYVFLTDQNYDESLKWLTGTGSHLKPLDAQEKQILSWMISQDKIQQDPDPRAIAIRLKAQLLWMREQETVASSEAPSFSDVHYEDLLQTWERTPLRFRLTSEEEALLSRFFYASNVLVRHNSLFKKQPQMLPEKLVAPLQEATSALLNPRSYFELFKCHELYEALKAEANKHNGEAKPVEKTPPSYFVHAKNWSQNFITSAYSCMKEPTKAAIQTLHRQLFNTTDELRPESELLQEILQSFQSTLLSHSATNERALSALFLATYAHPADFPPPSELADLFYFPLEFLKGPEIFKLRMTERVDKWVSKHLLEPVEKHCIPLLQMSKASPVQTVSQRQIEPPTLFWNAQSTQLRPSFIAPEMPLDRSFTTEVSFPFTQAHAELTTTFAADEVMSQRLQEFIRSGKSKSISYQTEELQGILQQSHQALLATREKEELLATQILKVANQLEKDPTQRLYQMGGYLSDFEKPIELPELLKFFLTQDASALQIRNPALSLTECHDLLRSTQAYLVAATQRQHFERIYKKCLAANQSEGAEKEKRIQDLAAEGMQKRAYQPHEHPEYLMIEYANQIRLRQDQLEAIRQFKPGTAQEAIMGFGKTLVLLPLLSFKAADGEKLSLVVMPKELVPSMAEALDKTLGKSFGQAIEVFSFDRNMQVSFSFLENTYARLEQAITKRKVVTMSESDIQTLFLMAIESFHDQSPLAPSYRKILTLLKTSGHLILDEMHHLLDVFQSHHFSEGDKQPLPASELEGAAHLFPILISLGWDGSSSISKEEYVGKWKNPLLEAVIQRPEFAPYSHQTLRSYLQENRQAEAYVEKIPSKRIKNLLATYKEQIQRVLPLILHRELGEHFGAIPKDRVPLGQSKWMAIPYHGSQNPAVGSQCGSNLEMIDYTLRLHLSKGIEMEILEKELDRLKSSISAEKKDLELTSHWETPSYQRFVELAGTDRYSLYTLTPEEKEAILQNINQKAQFKIDLIHRWILTELNHYPLQLYTNGHIFGDLVQSIRGFSGTNWNEKTFPAHFQTRLASDTQSYTLHLLQSKKEPILVAKNAADLIEQAQGLPIIDRGAVYKEFENRQIARRILDTSQAKGIVFYEDNQLKVLLRAQKEPILYANCPLAKEELTVYWDQKHTTGSDIPLATESRAVVTIGRHTHLFELLQAVWRMRGLGKHQNVQLAMLDSEALYIQEFLHRETKRPQDTPLQLKDVLKYSWLKESERQKEHSVRALKFKLASVFLDPLLNQITDPNQPLPNPKILEEFFYLKEPQDPWDLYGPIAASIPKQDYGKQLIHHFRQSTYFKTLPIYEQQTLHEKLEAIIEAELPHLPKLIPSHATTYGREVQTRVQTQTEQQKETQIEQETQVQKTLIEQQNSYSARGFVSWEGTLSQLNFTPSKAQSLASLSLALQPNQPYPLKLFQEQGLNPVVSVQDALSFHNIDSPFNPSLLASATFMPLQQEQGKQRYPAYPYTPFGKHQDGVREMLIIQDQNTSEFKLMLLSQDEAKQFEERLKQKRASLENGVKLALYQPGYGLYAQGPDFPTEKQLQKHPQFQQLKVQAKFFNGDVSYSRDEIRALEAWFSTLKQLDQAKDLFEKQILVYKRESALQYPNSPLYRCFQRMQQKATS
jgi:hypothetical protein